MSLKEVIEFFKTKTRQLVARKKMEELRDRAKQFASRENIRNMAAKAKGVASKENVANVITKAKEIATKENMENFATKAKSLASKEKLEEAKQCVQSLATADGRKTAVDKFRSMPTKRKVISVCLAGLVVWFILHIVSCVGSAVFGIGGQSGCKKIDADTNLLLTTLPTMEVEEGVGYPYLGMGLKALQWLPDKKAVIAVLDWDGGMGFSGGAIQLVAMSAGGELGFLGGGLMLEQLKKHAQPIYLKTQKSYTDGASIDEQSIFVYDGIVTYKTRNGSRSVRSFREVNPKYSKKYFDELERKGKERERKEKEEKEKMEQEESEKRWQKILDENICDGYTVSLPDTLKVKSICGIKFGVPTKEAVKNLGELIFEDMIYYDDAFSRTILRYKLKTPFRLFNRVCIVPTEEAAPYRVVKGVALWGSLDASKYSVDACKNEFSAIMSLLSEKYNLKFEKCSDNSFNDSFNAAIDGTWPLQDSRVFLAWKEGKSDRASYDFILVVDASNVVEDCTRKLKANSEAKERAEIESKKQQKVFSAKEGGDVL